MAMRFTKSSLRRAPLAVSGAVVLSFACLSLVAQGRDPSSASQGRTTPAPGAAQGRSGGRGRSDAVRPQMGRPIHVLFLGQAEEQPHNPVKMFPLLAAPLARRGIQLTYE